MPKFKAPTLREGDKLNRERWVDQQGEANRRSLKNTMVAGGRLVGALPTLPCHSNDALVSSQALVPNQTIVERNISYRSPEAPVSLIRHDRNKIRFAKSPTRRSEEEERKQHDGNDDQQSVEEE
jgi:hypothetical protein